MRRTVGQRGAVYGLGHSCLPSPLQGAVAAADGSVVGISDVYVYMTEQLEKASGAMSGDCTAHMPVN